MSNRRHAAWWCASVLAAASAIAWQAPSRAQTADAKASSPGSAAPTPASQAPGETPDQARLRAELKANPHKIVYETWREGNWELVMMKADGSEPVNLTRTPKVHEMYPHASPDGSMICFVADEGEGDAKSRNVYLMKADGTGRTLLARNARDPCWTADGREILYAKGEFERFTYKDFASKQAAYCDVPTGRHRDHPNPNLHHLYALCCAPGGKWFLATVHGGMGFNHAILAIQTDGSAVFALPGINGCRPDVSPDGRKVSWNASDQVIAVADLDLTGARPTVANVRQVVTCSKAEEVYHSEWSPDGKYLLFAHGPKGDEQVGLQAKGWNICAADASRTNVWVTLTSDGASDKEPDWVPAGGKDK